MPQSSNRKRRAVAEPEDDDTQQEDDEDDVEADQDEELHETQDHAASAVDDMVKALVRLALAAEYQRRPLRRQEISEKVLGNNGRSFKKVFARTQEELQAVFGMELVELPVKGRVTTQQRRAAQQKSDAPKPATSWMLCSVLPTEYRQPSIIPPSSIPDATEDANYTAIYTMLVSMVSLNNGILSEGKMERYLRGMGLEDATPIAGFEKTEKLLKRLERDGYLVKIREQIGTGGEEEVSWVVGPRGKIEVGDAGVHGLVTAVYGDPQGNAASELSDRIQRSLGVNERTVPAAKKKPGRPRAKRADHDDDDD